MAKFQGAYTAIVCPGKMSERETLTVGLRAADRTRDTQGRRFKNAGGRKVLWSLRASHGLLDRAGYTRQRGHSSFPHFSHGLRSFLNYAVSCLLKERAELHVRSHENKNIDDLSTAHSSASNRNPTVTRAPRPLPQVDTAHGHDDAVSAIYVVLSGSGAQLRLHRIRWRVTPAAEAIGKPYANL